MNSFIKKISSIMSKNKIGIKSKFKISNEIRNQFWNHFRDESVNLNVNVNVNKNKLDKSNYNFFFSFLICASLLSISLFTSNLLKAETNPDSTKSVAQTIVQKRIAELNKLIAMKKITVGPQDQYQGVPDPTESILVFTHKSNLSPRLMLQDLATGVTFNLLPETADSQEPNFNQNGDLVFTYFKDNARGDICYIKEVSKLKTTVSDNAIHCIKRTIVDESQLTSANNTNPKSSSVERLNPFWVNNTEIGFIEHVMNSDTRKIVTQNIESGAQKVLFEGKIWSPQMTPGGRYLTFNQIIKEDGHSSQRPIVILDLLTHETHQLSFELPGLSAFPILSKDEKFLYFSQYLNDTNADNMIDGNDNAVIFRMPIEKIDLEEYFPEQLTPVEKNCNFPKPTTNLVYVTCDFEGSLDIYQFPLTGIVPYEWKLDLLKNALHTSRSYQERVLLYNTMKYRFPNENQNANEDLFINHLFSKDNQAAQYYLEKMKLEKTNQYLPQFFDLMRIHLESKNIKKKLETQPELSQEVVFKIQNLESNLKKITSYPRLSQLILAELLLLKKEDKIAWSIIEKIHFKNDETVNKLTSPTSSTSTATNTTISNSSNSSNSPNNNSIRSHKKSLSQSQNNTNNINNSNSKNIGFNKNDRSHFLERFLYFEIANDATHTKPQANSKDILKFYNEVLHAPELSDDSQIYYGVQFLVKSEKLIKESKERVEFIQSINDKTLSEPLTLLFQSEVLGLQIILATDSAKKEEFYRELDKIMSQTRNKYDLRKAIYVRTILNFNQAHEFHYLSLITSNWLRYTEHQDTEFIYAREVFTDASLEQAYANLAKHELVFADNFFYQSLSLSDDLESHYGFITTLIQENKRSVITDRYNNLQKRQFIDDNMKYVEVLLLLIDTSSLSGTADEHSINNFKQAIEKIEAMTVDRDSPLRYLLLGYCELQEFLITAKGFAIDSQLLNKAHHDLMLAYDLGRDNVRVKAASLMNLGILHLRENNPGVATEFFALRKKLGFSSDMQKANFAWIYARSLFLANQTDLAAQEISQLDANLKNVYFIERESFYLIASQKYKEALPLLESLVHGAKIQGPINLSRLYMNYGLALFKNAKESEAKKALEQALAFSEQTHEQKSDSEHLMDYKPQRIQLIITGLLGQMGSAEDKIKFLQKRKQILKDSHALFEEWAELEIKNDLQRAYLLKEQNQQEAFKVLFETIKESIEIGKASSYLSSTVLQPTVAFLSFGIMHPNLDQSTTFGEMQKFIQTLNENFDKQKMTSPFIKYQELKIKILWALYQNKIINKAIQKNILLSDLLKSDLSENVKKSLPKEWQELANLERFF